MGLSLRPTETCFTKTPANDSTSHKSHTSSCTLPEPSSVGNRTRVVSRIIVGMCVESHGLVWVEV